MGLKTSGPGFSRTRAKHALAFISNLTHTKDRWAGQDFAPRKWQIAIIRELFGRMRADNPKRRAIRTMFLGIGRKNGKSEMAAAFALYGLVGDGVIGAEVYSAAADRDQASLVFNVAAQMVRNDPLLSSRLQIIESQKRIVDLHTGSFYRAISAEAYSKHGFNASMVIYDEVHAAPNRELWDVLATSMGARYEPLMIAITTAGYDRHSICYELYDYARKVLDGTVIDPSFYAVIFEAPETADWNDEAVWKLANPALEDFRDIDEIRSLAHRAKEIPALQNTFRRLYLNQWTEQSERWIDMHAWDDCARGDWRNLRESLRGRPCYAGLDLSTRYDLTALVLLFEDEASGFIALPFFWVPEDNILKRSHRDRVPYEQWAKDGLLTATPGDAVDHRITKRDVLAIAQTYPFRELGFDPWEARWIEQEFKEAGLEIVSLKSGNAKDASDAIKDLGASITSRRLTHGGHPILRWNAANAVVKQNAEGFLALDKEKATERIDGVVALTYAMAVRNRHPKNTAPSYTVAVLGGRR